MGTEENQHFHSKMFLSFPVNYLLIVCLLRTGQHVTSSSCAGVKRAAEPNFRFPDSLGPVNSLRKPSVTSSQREKCLPCWQTRYHVTSETGDSCLVRGSRPRGGQTRRRETQTPHCGAERPLADPRERVLTFSTERQLQKKSGSPENKFLRGSVTFAAFCLHAE